MIFLYLIFSLKAFAWTKVEQQLYQERKFYELQMHLYLKQRTNDVIKIKRQEKNLDGCKEIYLSSSHTASFIKCLDFLIFEEKIGLKMSNPKELYSDLNTFCVKKSADQNFMEKLFAEKINLKNRKWSDCSAALWKQIYLTAYANIQAQPLKTKILIRNGDAYVGQDKVWRVKVNGLHFE
jgi:hypothetical protein